MVEQAYTEIDHFGFLPTASTTFMRVRIGTLLCILLLLLSSVAWANTTYVVKEGDILGSIAERHGCSVADIKRWNPSLDPDRIRVGQRLVIRSSTASPTSSAGSASARPDEYVVVAGDTMSGIAAKLGVSYNALVAANRNVNADRIQIGQKLRVPTGAAARPAAGAAAGRVHVVAAGDTVSAIAASYGVSVADLQSWNRGLNPDRISVGQNIQIRSGRPVRELSYTVVQGDILGRIAERNDVTVSELLSWNRGLDANRIRIGQTIRIFQEGPESVSESHGTAANGRLVNGEQLPRHAAYTVRSSRRAWGTNDTITYLMAGYDHIKRVYPNIPRIAIHDLSAEHGGHLTPHRSHQSGRDADIGYYHTGCTRSDCQYRAIRASELNPEYQWELFKYWIDQGTVEYIFVDYTLQEPLYEYAKKKGVSQRTLDRVFQYPRGRHARGGIIRHEPGHRTHFHVRFACGPRDTRCR